MKLEDDTAELRQGVKRPKERKYIFSSFWKIQKNLNLDFHFQGMVKI